MRRSPSRLAAGLTFALLAAGCASGRGRGPLSESARRFVAEAAAQKPIAFEEDYVDARLILQSLPREATERTKLRKKLLDYLLGPLVRLDTEELRRDPATLGAPDDFDRIFDSFRDALDLFAATELWQLGGPRLTADERALLGAAARVVVATFSPRGNETAVAGGLFVLASIEPASPEWKRRLDELLPWVEMGGGLARSTSASNTQPTTIEVLESLAIHWPVPVVINRLADSYIARQQQLATTMRRPLGTGSAQNGMSEFLLEGETIQTTAVNLAALYLRCGQRAKAAESLRRMANKPGDEPELRELVVAAARPDAGPDEFLALARRFLPRGEILGGTSNDRLDPVAAVQVIEDGLDRFPRHVGLLLVASRVSRFLPAPFLALRYIQEAKTLIEASSATARSVVTMFDKAKTADDVLGALATEELDLSFSRLRLRVDPGDIEPVAREAEILRRQLAQTRKRFGDDRVRLGERDIDLELARGFLNAGLVDRAEALFSHAGLGSDSDIEVSLQMANLALKRGDAPRAARIVGEAMTRHGAHAPIQETIGWVESGSKLSRALGNALEVQGKMKEAREAWGNSAKGWERLMVEHLKRKNALAASEATLEVGRLYYLVGRRTEGKQKFMEAIEESDRDQSFIDAISFLVQHGEADAALDIYRVALSKPDRAVSEYVKVYASLWVLDLTRRAGAPDASAEGYLRGLDTRKVHLRPPRDAAWYLPLARYAVGRLSFEQLRAMADKPARLAELYFYEAMRRLADGKSDGAHELWNKVLETKMVSFFEFEMASRYLRTGAPSRAPRDNAADTETI